MARRGGGDGPDETLRWRSDFDKFVVTANFERRGWERWSHSSDDDWNVFWANVHTVKQGPPHFKPKLRVTSADVHSVDATCSPRPD